MPLQAAASRQPVRVRTRVLIVIVALVLVLGGLIFGWFVLENPSCAKPPTPQERSQQESFVIAHLPDAGDFECTVMDCDENGQAYLSFDTSLTRAASSAAFLRDPACRASTEADASPGDPTCRSGNTNVTIYLTKDVLHADGELYLDQH